MGREVKLEDEDERGLGSSLRAESEREEDVAGVLKARVDQNWRIGLLWEGRVKDLLFTLGASFDLKKREQVLRTVGLEVQYSS